MNNKENISCSDDEEAEENDDEELEENENEDENVEINTNENSNSYKSALTTMDWGLQSHPDYHEDYWIGDSGASSHMVGDAKDLVAKTPIQGKVNAVNGTSMPIVYKGKMNVEVVPKQGKLSRGVLTVKVADRMFHKLFSFTTALMYDWKMYGTKKVNGNIEITLTHKHFKPFLFHRVLRFDDAILIAAKIKTLPIKEILNLIIKIRILQNGIIEPSRHGLTPYSTGLEHLLTVGCFA